MFFYSFHIQTYTGQIKFCGPFTCDAVIFVKLSLKKRPTLP